MEHFFTMETLWSLAAIVFIDLILAGDNALVIGMAARNLPQGQQKKAIFWGTFGAIFIRAVSTLVVVWLLRIPALMITGGVLLIWIAYKLIVEEKQHEVNAPSGLGAAIRTIVVADGVMGIDNVMGIAGVAHGNMLLVLIGIAITIPIIIWGSTVFIKLIERYPWLIYAGGGILAWTAGGMICGDSLLTGQIAVTSGLKWTVQALLTVVLLAVAWRKKQAA